MPLKARVLITGGGRTAFGQAATAQRRVADQCSDEVYRAGGPVTQSEAGSDDDTSHIKAAPFNGEQGGLACARMRCAALQSEGPWQTCRTMVRDPVLPTLRAATFSIVCLGLGIGAHRMMSGAAVPLWAIVFSGVSVYMLARIGSGRERGLLGIGALIGVLQLALHLLFEYAQHVSAEQAVSALAKVMVPGICRPPVATPTPRSMSPAMGAMPGMGKVVSTTIVPTAVPHMSDTGMLLAHVLAAVLSAWWLHRSEAAVHALARSAGAWVLRFIAAPLPVVRIQIRGPRIPRTESAPQRPRPQCLGGSRLVRGPPRIPSFA